MSRKRKNDLAKRDVGKMCCDALARTDCKKPNEADKKKLREPMRKHPDEFNKYTVKDPGGWSVVSVAKKHYTGAVSKVHRWAVDRIAGIA